MNTQAHNFEVFGYNDSVFQFPKNTPWQYIREVKDRLGKRLTKTQVAKRERARLSEMNDRLTEASNYIFFG